MSRGFTIVELLIVVSLIAILSVSILAVVNPIEQINKSQDVKVKNLLTEIFKAHIQHSLESSENYSVSPLVASALSSVESQPFIDALISSQSLKNTSSSDPNLGKIFITSDSIDKVVLCYLPKAIANQVSKEPHFDNQGNPKDTCSSKGCYYCLSSIVSDIAVISTPTPASAIGPCSGFDPERPNFPFTSNYSSKWSVYGCTNYSVNDSRGCDSFCPSGQRHLIKSYYGVPFSAVCLSKTAITTENYCVAEPYANCAAHPNSSSDLDFNYGCTNPRRPYSWK